MEETIKFFYDYELTEIFKELENRRQYAKTEYSLCSAIRNEAFYKLMYYCALRVTEVTKLETDAFNPMYNKIYCKRLKGSYNNTLEIIEQDIVEILNKHIDCNKPGKYLFENKKGNPISRKTADVIIKSVCKSANIKDSKKWHCHTFKHTRAIWLAEKGFDLKDIQYWLGHKEISNTQIYFQFTSKQNEALYKKLAAFE